jgi:hypothetical protein
MTLAIWPSGFKMRAIAIALAWMASASIAVNAPAVAQTAVRDCAAAQNPRAATPSADQIRERAARIKELRGLLDAADVNLRLAAFDEMVKSCDVAMQEVAFEVAFNSAELGMRSLALRQRLVRLSGLTLELAHPPGKAADGQPPPMDGRITLAFNHRDEANGVVGISAKAANIEDPKDMKDVLGTVRAMGLELVIDATRLGAGWNHCSGRLRLGNAGQLAGTLSCYGLPNLVATGRLL